MAEGMDGSVASSSAFVGQMWEVASRPGRLKSALLFFDRLYAKATEEDLDRAIDADASTVGALVDRGALTTIPPEQYMHEGVYDLQDRLFEALIDAGALEPRPLHEYGGLAMTKIHRLRPSGVREGTAQHLFDLGLAVPLDEGGRPHGERLDDVPYRRGILRRTFELPAQNDDWVRDDGAERYVGLHPTLAELHTAIVATCAPSVGQALGLRLVAVRGGSSLGGSTSRSYEALRSALAHLDEPLVRPRGRGVIGRLIESDLQTVGVDVGDVELDEILDFKASHRSALRAYEAGLLELVAAASMADFDEDEVARIVAGRSADLVAAAGEIRAATLRRFGVTGASIAVGITGFGWYLSQNDPMGALLALVPGLLAAVTTTPPAENRFSYALTLSGDRGRWG